VVFDWAGTTIDFGSCAPVAAFLRVFAAQDVMVTVAEARAPMGLPKRDHLRTMLQLPTVAQRWREAHGRDWNNSGLATLYERFMAHQLEALDQHNDLVPGVLDCTAALRRLGIRIGASTGYFRAAAARVCAAAARQGFVPDVSVCVDDVPAGRPAPWMIYRIMEAVEVYPPAAVVKVGDTVPDIAEGLSAGAWSIGVTKSSSEVGCSEEEFHRLSAAEQQPLLTQAREKFRSAGAHAVLDTLAELPDLIAELNRRLGGGVKP
jgi:phosphonoacetaldehyde hydrolase